MSYSPASGFRSSSPTQTPSLPPTQSALPPRPPSSNRASSSPHPLASTASTTYPSIPRTHNSRESSRNTSSHVSAPSYPFAFQPRTIATQSQSIQSRTPIVSAAPTPLSSFVPPSGNEYGRGSLEHQSSQNTSSSHVFGSSTLNTGQHAYLTSPPIRNPFPIPGQLGKGTPVPHGQEIMDPEMEAQIAQWQSAYAGKDANQSNSRALTNKFSDSGHPSLVSSGTSQGHRGESTGMNSSAVTTDTAIASVITASDGKQKTVIRHGGGQTWQDPSLLEWDPANFRLFVGNLAGEVTDDSLLKAFSKYSSVQKARVVRDKRTTKSKGFGFVSFADGEEYFQAARDMQGKYIGSHPVLLRKSTTEIRPTASKDQRRGGKGSNGGGRRDQVTPTAGRGIQKVNGKVKNGLKLLG